MTASTQITGDHVAPSGTLLAGNNAAPSGTLRYALKVQFQVLHAIMLHDIKSRFFGSGIGYIVTILWPAAHLALVIGIFYFQGRQIPYGSSPILYASTGVLPYIIWNYISRFTMLGITTNKSFINYPIVKPLDIIIGRQALELVTSTIITFGVFLLLVICNIDPIPIRPVDAAMGLLSAVCLGVGFGVLGSVIVMIFPLFNIFYVGILISFWLTAGVAINPEQMPPAIGNIFAWSPLLDCVELMRLGYYNDYPARLLSRSYVFEVAGTTFTLGLVLERILKKYTLGG